ncbi:hypothetical protein NE236_12560 [Actinoallomurus purpureus]|uniref:hypothetical protein n=1 Tax=Actinoallomurus purpureus TaxID=478114 RepID=UPI002092D045|nr:hypothetical protein [Actinoallomurus purpureus]MCO6005817.1 hypothetical protein [Actinoallomurus purpureus]
MKTTVDISAELVREVRRMAQEEDTTLDSLIDEGLRAVLARRGEERRYVLPDVSVGGEGLQPEVRAAAWSELCSLAYEDRL